MQRNKFAVGVVGGVTAMVALGGLGTYLLAGSESTSSLDKAAGTTINASGAIQLVLCVAVGALAMLAAIAGSRPLLRKVTAGPVQTAD